MWDRDHFIAASSPFPHRIYFILNIGRFLQMFSSVEDIAEKLIWLPTEHQARLLCTRLGVGDAAAAALGSPPLVDPLLGLYGVLLDTLRVRTTPKTHATAGIVSVRAISVCPRGDNS
ncbi:MAG: hypothetical protein AB7G75_22460 [Candidatus Binatia bacterium]